MLRFLRQRPGLAVLLILLAWITVSSLRQGVYLIGWDNYSSYFGGLEGLFRTVFSTWRAYRGIGVPSDSESVDVFRQLALLILSPVIPEPLLDQVYIIGCLWIGALSVYLLMERILRRLHENDTNTDIPSALAAGAYILNLQTLSVFYFPIITYITRYASLPLLLFVFDRYIHDKASTTGNKVAFVAAVLFSAGSFITATVFFTTFVLLAVYALTQGALRKSVVALTLFVVLNAFWLVPFVHYTVQKSATLRLTPAFIDTNESQFNLPPVSYSPARQLVLYPNFFDTEYTDIRSGNRVAFHPSADGIKTTEGAFAVRVFPVIAILGAILMGIRPVRYRSMLWIPALYLFFVVLASQEYSPVGFIPALLNRYVPYFRVVFRFGDTKFHPYIAVTGVLLVGFAISRLLAMIRSNRARYVLVAGAVTGIVVFPLLTVFRPFVTGGFLPQYLMTVLPRAYKMVAARINADERDGRVLHLPYDPNLYWRSHTWGYMGSAFMQYMLNMPYLDKTFEPASLETTDLYDALTRVIADANQTVGPDREARAQELLHLLRRYGVRWVLYDGSVSPEIGVRNIRYWGSFNTTDSEVLLDALVKSGDITLVDTQKIDLESVADTYRQTVGVHPAPFIPETTLRVYEIDEPHHAIHFEVQSTSIDPMLTRVQQCPGHTGIALQGAGNDDVVLYPMLYKDSSAEVNGSGISMRHVLPRLSDRARAAVSSGNTTEEAVVSVSVLRRGNTIQFRLSQVLFPDINDNTFRRALGNFDVPVSLVPDIGETLTPSEIYRSDWHVLGHAAYSPVRIAVEDTILPVPPLSDGQEAELGTVLVRGRQAEVRVLRKSSEQPLPADSFSLTTDPNCFGDRQQDYKVEMNGEGDTINLDSRNGSSCIVAAAGAEFSQSEHAEVFFRYEADSTDDDTDRPDAKKSAKLQVMETIMNLPKPNIVSVCLAQAGEDGCANRHQLFMAKDSGQVIVPAERSIQGPPVIRAGVVPIGRQAQHLTVYEARMFGFRTVARLDVDIPADQAVASVTLSKSDLQIRMPYIQSAGSYYFQPGDAYFVTNRPCEQEGGYRTVRRTQSGMLSYLNGCYSEASVRVPFDSALSRLWTVSYSVQSGKYPRLLLGDSFSSYVDRPVSVFEGYPDIAGMQQLAAPQSWFMPYQNDTIRSILHTAAVVQRTYARVKAVPELTDTRPKFVTLHQDSQNEGIMIVGGMTVTEYPPAWDGMALTVGQPVRQYAEGGDVIWQEILPSLVRVRAGNTTDSGDRLLVQRSGFDAQWRAYTSRMDLLIGRGIIPQRCDGFANCYVVPQAEEYFLLYTPERLAVAGWLASFLALAIFLSKRRSASRT